MPLLGAEIAKEQIHVLFAKLRPDAFHQFDVERGCERGKRNGKQMRGLLCKILGRSIRTKLQRLDGFEHPLACSVGHLVGVVQNTGYGRNRDAGVIGDVVYGYFVFLLGHTKNGLGSKGKEPLAGGPGERLIRHIRFVK